MASRHGVVWPVGVDRCGRTGPTRSASRGPRWRRTSRGLFVPAEVDGSTPEQRICEAAALLPEVGCVTGWAALRWAGGAWFDGTSSGGREARPVTLAVGGRVIAAQTGIRLSQERLGRDEIVLVDGVRTADPMRALCFEARYAPSLRAAVEAIDLAAYSDLVSVSSFALYVAVRTGWTGIEQCRRAVALADENSWSPRETWLRLVGRLVADLPPTLSNVPVFDRSGRHLGTPDLIEPAAGVVCEYDGAEHLSGDRRRRDLARHDAFRGAGLEVVVVMAGEPEVRVAERLVAAHRRAARRPPALSAAWTLDPPHWWVSTGTVDQRRALTAAQRDRWLRLRRRTA